MSNFVFGAQLYTLREVMKDEESIAAGLKKLAEFGYKTVQLSAIPYAAANPKWFREECDKNGLKIISTHSDFGRMENDLDALLGDHVAMGCVNMGIGAMPPEYRMTADGARAFAKAAQPIAAKAKEAGINFIYHNHRFEFGREGDKTFMDIIMDGAPDLMLLPDLYWVTAAGVAASDFLAKYLGRYNQVHFKDMKIVNDECKFCEIGQGNMNYIALAEQLIEYGIKDIVVEQDICDGDPYDSLKMSIDYLKKVLCA